MPTPTLIESPAFFWLFLATLSTAVMWLPHILQLIMQEGLASAVYDPDRSTEHKAEWARRARRAHSNAVENIAVFAPLMLMAIVADTVTAHVETAGLIYLLARWGHYIAYTLAVPVVRVLLFLIGWAATMTIAVELAGAFIAG